MTTLHFPRPMGATRYIVTVADLDDALRMVLQKITRYAIASVSSNRAEKQLQLQGYRLAVKEYRQLQADALPEIRVAHMQHQKIIAA